MVEVMKISESGRSPYQEQSLAHIETSMMCVKVYIKRDRPRRIPMVDSQDDARGNTI